MPFANAIKTELSKAVVSIILLILDTMVEDVGTVGPLVADEEWQAMARSKAKDKGFPAIRLS